MTSTDPIGVSTAAHLRRALVMRTLVLGRLTSAALHADAVLGVPDLLHERPRTASELAEDLGVDPDALARLLRTLVALGVLAELDGATFEPTELGQTLRSEVPGSARSAALLAGAELGQCWDRLLDVVYTGVPAFPTVFGTDVFSYMQRQDALRETFFRSQSADLDITVAQLLEVVSVRGLVVDVGGGDAGLVEHLLNATPTATAIVLDLPSVAVAARARVRAAGLQHRCTVQDGDFFTAVPTGGDLYVLRDILHDWSDARCVELLLVCRRAMPTTAELLVVERVAGEGAHDSTGPLHGLMDLYMLVALGGRERERREWDRLLAEAGFVLAAAHRLGGGAMAFVARQEAG